MKMGKRILFITGIIVVGSILACLLNFFVLQNILIPDPCYYHDHETNKVFDLFYTLSAGEGYHPFPTPFNFLFTLFVGGVSGFMLAKKIRYK
jgi:hypothetical protein